MNPHPRFSGTLPTRAWLGFVSLVNTTLLACLLAGATIAEAGESTWSATGSFGTTRYGGHTATLLANGKVLLVGGVSGSTGSAELYDPATGTWSYTGNLNTTRTWPAATLLPNGKVLVAGGWDHNARPLNSAELYDPAAGTWSYTGNRNTAGGGGATLLPDGKVLVVSGNTAELYDPGTGMWRSTGNLHKAHIYGGGATLRNGKVLIVGGNSFDASNSTEIYDPATETWSVTGNLNTGRLYGHSATLLPNGKVLVAGGSFDGDDLLESAELYDPVTGTWSETRDLNEDRINHTATLLPNGKVLVAGGYGYGNDSGSAWSSLNSAELYDPDTESWSVTPSMNTARAEHAATLLANGKVLVAAGDAGSGGIPNSAELYDAGFEIPLLTLNSTSYCIGDRWDLTVIHSARQASVHLMGVSNGASWETPRWGATDDNGSFIASGTIADGTEGTHILRVEISGVRSNAFAFAVSKCKP
jgi:Kelch motif/Galactose oxidase, central domain